MKNFSLSFPNTPEAKPDLETFLRSQATGERVTIDGRYLRMEDRDERLLAPIRSWKKTLTIGSTPSKESYPIRLEVESEDGKYAEIPLIELRLIKKGDVESTFSNGYEATPAMPEQKASPVLVSLVFRENQDYMQFKFEMVGSCPTTQEVFATIPFLDIFLRGGRFRMRYLRRSQSDEPKWEDCKYHQEGISPGFKRLIEMLRIIEVNTNNVFHTPDWKIGDMNVDVIHVVWKAVTTGKISCSCASTQISFNKKWLRASPENMENMLANLEKAHGNVSIKTDAQNQALTLLGTAIQLGPCIASISGRIISSNEELRQVILHGHPDDELTVELADTQITMNCLNWPKTTITKGE